jgi:hypothetical protein
MLRQKEKAMVEVIAHNKLRRPPLVPIATKVDVLMRPGGGGACAKALKTPQRDPHAALEEVGTKHSSESAKAQPAPVNPQQTRGKL